MGVITAMMSLGLLVIRLVVGGIFSIHGYAKAFGGEGKSEQLPPEVKQTLGSGFAQQLEHGGISGTAGVMRNLGLPRPAAMAALLAAAELGGGLALILGWKTRPAALALAVSQLVAINKVHGKNGLIAEGGYELNAVLTAATTALAIAGPGAIAVD